MSEPATESKKSSYDHVPNWAIVGLFVFAAVVGVLAFALRSPSTGDEFGAERSCQRVVETRLKSPGSADFSNQTASHVDGDWTVQGAVDSENSFGAKVRNTYTCELRYTDDDWSLTSVSVSQN